jgi:hypothetical protein
MTLNDCGPKLSPYLKNIIINKKGSKHTYNLLNTSNIQTTSKEGNVDAKT